MASDIGKWLEELELERYVEVFLENEIDLEALRYISEDDLKDIGVALGARRKILNAIACLGNGPAAAVTPAAAARPPEHPEAATPAGEQRQVTVLFADLAGFTALSGEMGAEATHALLNRYFELVDGVVEGYGGSIDKHMGDNVMAVFGAPIAHSNDPERAVRAALDIHGGMAKLSQEARRSLQAHIGIASGQVVASGTGSDAHREYTVTGGSVNLASRLQEKAGPGETLLSSAVQRAVSDCAVCSPMGEVAVKGFDQPIEVWRLSGLRDDASTARLGPFVGRRAERRQFGALVEECLETGAGQAVLVRGEAGIGKTRLVEEFTSLAVDKGFASHKGLVLDFGVGKGQDAIRGLVRSLLGLSGGSGNAVRANAADAVIEEGWVGEDDRVFLNDLLDLPQPLELRSLYDAMDNATRSRGKQATVARLIKCLSAEQPLLITVEDVHWAGELTLAHLATIAATVADCPALMVTTSRIENDPFDQAWRASLQGSPLTTLDLQPLRATEAQELASGFAEVGSDLVRDCIERAGGNPLFLEQLLRKAEEGALSEIPGSIQSLVLARMDHLEPHDKQALQAAAILGQRFAPDVLRHLIGDPGYDAKALFKHALIRPEGDACLFTHALIREGVYTSLLQAQRRELHRRAASWFQTRDPALYAEHLDRAEDARAPRAYLEAARAQAAAYHYERAIAFVERGLAKAKDASDKCALTCLRGKLLYDQGDIPSSIEAYQAALDIASDDAARVPAWIGMAAGMRLTDAYDEALETLDQAEAVAARLKLDLELSRIHHLRGNLYFPLGDMDGCLDQHRLALEYAQKVGSPESEAQALGGLADAEYARGRMHKANGHFQRCIALCREHGFGRIEVANLSMLGLTRFYLGDLKGALEDSLAAVKAAARVNHHRAELISLLCVHYPALEFGDLPLIEETLARAAELIRRLGARRFEPDRLNFLARCRMAQGRCAEALDLLREAVKVMWETGATYCGPRVLGYLALVTDNALEREQAVKEGKEILQSGAVAHNYFWFYRDVIEAALNLGEWDMVDSHAQALDDFTRAEPLPWTGFFIARGRALAEWGRGRREPELVAELRHLRSEAERLNLTSAIPAIDKALKAA